MATGTSLSSVFPLGSRLNERGRLEVGGCDTIELAREFGTPAYVVAEDDLRARARAFVQAGRDVGPRGLPRGVRLQGLPLHGRAASCSPQEGLWCDVASGGELHLALSAGFRAGADRAARQRQVRGRAAAWRCGIGVGLIVIDNFDEIDRLEGLLAEALGGARASGCSCASRRTCGETRTRRSRPARPTRSSASRWREAQRGDRARAGDRRADAARACTRTSARSCSSSSRFVREVRRARRARGLPGVGPRRRAGRALHRGSARAARDRGVRRRRSSRPRTRTAWAPTRRLLIEPGRSLTRERRA